MKSLTRPFAVASLVILSAACAATRRPGTTTTTAAAALDSRADEDVGACIVECGPVTTSAATTPDHHAGAVSDADGVFAAMHDDLLACYRAHGSRDPRAHAFLTVDVVLNPEGSVRSVKTTGGAMLGDAGLACIKRRVERATFAPVWGGGTLHLSIPLNFRRIGLDETI